MPPRQHAPVASMSPSTSSRKDRRRSPTPAQESSSSLQQASAAPTSVDKSSTSMQPPQISSSQESNQSTDTSSSTDSFGRHPPYSQTTSSHTESTPPSSSDGPSDPHPGSQPTQSSQQSTIGHSPITFQRPKTPPLHAGTSSRPPPLELNSNPTSPTSAVSQTGRLVQGYKRTANGEVKLGSHPGSPADTIVTTHTRNASIDSTGSNISELSSQLRARLSYAMVKVQNGWQSRSLDEVEALASAKPLTSTQPRLRSALRSPTKKPIQITRHGGKDSQTFLDIPSPNKKQAIPSAAFQTRTSDLTSVATTLPCSRHSAAGNLTYESFWQNHAAPNPVSQYLQNRSTNPPNARISLAPAVSIAARPHPRRSESRAVQPTMLSALPTAKGKNNRDSDLSETPTVPNTPPSSSQPRTPVVRTPSQKTAMEKDAVETLLFMSSPGNSGYHPPKDLSATPLRATKTVGFVDGVGTGSDDEDTGLRRRVRQELSPDDEFNRMLDRMADDSSSDDEDIELLPRVREGYGLGAR